MLHTILETTFEILSVTFKETSQKLSIIFQFIEVSVYLRGAIGYGAWRPDPVVNAFEPCHSRCSAIKSHIRCALLVNRPK